MTNVWAKGELFCFLLLHWSMKPASNQKIFQFEPLIWQWLLFGNRFLCMINRETIATAFTTRFAFINACHYVFAILLISMLFSLVYFAFLVAEKKCFPFSYWWTSEVFNSFYCHLSKQVLKMLQLKQKLFCKLLIILVCRCFNLQICDGLQDCELYYFHLHKFNKELMLCHF